MVFSSITFLFYFFPIFLSFYFLLPSISLKNTFLLLASLVFYAWGEPWFVALMLLMIFSNYAIALAIDSQKGWRRPLVTTLGISANLLALGLFKYADFFIQTTNTALAGMHLNKSIALFGLQLPLGISFIVFHAISYLVDVHRQKVRANSNPLEIAVYLAMFPQLVAGPIVRYNTIYRQLAIRRATWGRASAGMRIFIIGLAQKVLVADETARIATAVFDHAIALSFIEAWVGLGAYTLQIYFDFMGYSNMAIGLALMMGFRFPRNFQLPYTSHSITEFWRRWHMSLSAWFRDYVYIPLGGNRGSDLRTYVNLCTVFLLCGLWHGASWTFVIWGIHHGIFLVIERAGLGRLLKAGPPAISWFYAMLAAMSGWVWFRAKDIDAALSMFASLVGFRGSDAMSFSTHLVLDPVTMGAMIIAFILAVTPEHFVRRSLNGLTRMVHLRRTTWAADTIMIAAFLILSALSIASGSYSPFLYFRF
jgi:alginate O-acetyltransferase complex protein AlgI